MLLAKKLQLQLLPVVLDDANSLVLPVGRVMEVLPLPLPLQLTAVLDDANSVVLPVGRVMEVLESLGKKTTTTTTTCQ